MIVIIVYLIIGALLPPDWAWHYLYVDILILAVKTALFEAITFTASGLGGLGPVKCSRPAKRAALRIS